VRVPCNHIQITFVVSPRLALCTQEKAKSGLTVKNICAFILGGNKGMARNDLMHSRGPDVVVYNICNHVRLMESFMVCKALSSTNFFIVLTLSK